MRLDRREGQTDATKTTINATHHHPKYVNIFINIPGKKCSTDIVSPDIFKLTAIVTTICTAANGSMCGSKMSKNDQSARGLNTVSVPLCSEYATHGK